MTYLLPGHIKIKVVKPHKVKVKLKWYERVLHPFTPYREEWQEVIEDGNGDDEGFLVEYADGGDSNHPEHERYISWSPRAVFENSYQGIYSGMSFGHAIEMLKAGHKVARDGWNGKGMYILHVRKGYYDVGLTLAGSRANLLPWIGMKTADGSFVPWLASQTDMLADDWVVV